MTARATAYGAGALIPAVSFELVRISAVSFELVDEAYDQPGAAPAAIDTLLGTVPNTSGNIWLARRGHRHATAPEQRIQSPRRRRTSRAAPPRRSPWRAA
ncbi:hypothetical protein [Streptomyces sp. NPDC102487]|uniref:hypothetical protein n=1 Tax=Streptomyces sp. NPDC102487 TaxID=3366182 RepID=UPI003811DFF2